MAEHEIKQALKEGLKEWLDERYATVGKWSLSLIAAGAVFAIAYFILTMNGWKHLG